MFTTDTAINYTLTREKCRTPAMYGISDVLCRTDNYGKNDHEDHRVPVVHTIHEVIVIPRVDLGDLEYSGNQSACVS